MPENKKPAKSGKSAKPEQDEALNKDDETPNKEAAATAPSTEEDPWAAALAEQAAADETPAAAEAPAPAGRRAEADEVFQPLDADTGNVSRRDLEMVMDIPVKLSVELGRTRITIKQLLELAQGSVVELDGLPGEPMDILINGYLIAQGEVVVIEDRFGIRITEIITPSERLQRLNR